MDVFNYKEFAVKIISKRFDVEHRDQKRYGLRDLAKLIGISSATLSRVINGGKVDLDTAILICKWLEVDITEFIL